MESSRYNRSSSLCWHIIRQQEPRRTMKGHHAPWSPPCLYGPYWMRGVMKEVAEVANVAPALTNKYNLHFVTPSTWCRFQLICCWSHGRIRLGKGGLQDGGKTMIIILYDWSRFPWSDMSKRAWASTKTCFVREPNDGERTRFWRTDLAPSARIRNECCSVLSNI